MSAQDINDLFAEPHHQDLWISVYNSSPERVFTNELICSESMTIKDSLFSDQNLRLGACESKEFSIKVVADAPLVGEWIQVAMHTDLPDVLVDSDGNKFVNSDGAVIATSTDDSEVGYPILGDFRVYSDKPTNDRVWRTLICYDAMYEILNADVMPWYNSLTFPMTLKALRDSFFDYIGANTPHPHNEPIEQETVTLPNDSLVIQGGFDVEGGLSGKTIIEAICELNGCFGHINGYTFEYITFDTYTEVTLDHYVDGTVSYEDYVVDNIDGVIVKNSEDDVGTASSSSTMVNPYIIQNNPLTYGLEGTQELVTALGNVYTALRRIMIYRPYKVTTYGNPFLEVGTKLTINARYETIESFVFTKQMTGIQALKDVLGATGDKTLASKVNSTPSQLKRTLGKVHSISDTVDELSSEIFEIDPQTGTKTSKITQLSDEIVLKVDANGNVVTAALTADASTGSSFEINADTLKFKANKTLDLTASTLNIESTNFKLDSAGNVTAQNFVIEASSQATGAFTIQESNGTVLGSWGGDYGMSLVNYTTSQSSDSATYWRDRCNFYAKTVYHDGSGYHGSTPLSGGFTTYVSLGDGITIRSMVDPWAVAEADRTKTMTIAEGVAGGNLDIRSQTGWGLSNLYDSQSLYESVSQIKDLVKVKKFDVACSLITSGMSLASYVTSNLDGGYKFLCWQECLSNGWVSSFPIYMSDLTSTSAGVYWNGTMPTTSGNNVRFSFLEIRNV